MDFLKRKPANTVPNTNTTTTTTSSSSSIPSIPSITAQSTVNNTNEKIEDVNNTNTENTDIIEKQKVKINDFIPKKGDQCVEPSILDKKIEMKYIKDGKSQRTFIFNLELYIKNKDDLANLINKMKKTFGTQCTYKETEFGFGYGFAGDLSGRIKKFLIDGHYVTSENFK